MLLLGVLLGMPMLLRAQEENPIVLELYCYGQVTASVADGHSGRGKVCASTSSSAPATSSNDWKTTSDMVRSQQYLPIRQNDVASLVDGLKALGVDVNIGPSTYSMIATMVLPPLYVHAQVTQDGYYFEGWKNKKGVIVSNDPNYPNNPTYAAQEGWNVRADEPYPSGEEEYGEMGPLYASFAHLEIGEVSGNLVIHPTTKDTLHRTIQIAVPHADSKGDFVSLTNDAVESLTGNGMFGLLSWNCSNGVVTIQYLFDPQNAAGVSTGQITLRTRGGESEKKIKLRANFANIASGNAPVVVCAPNATANAMATFATQYAEEKSIDFPVSPTFADNKWSVTSYSYANNEVRVNYTFDASGLTENTYETELTLATSAGVSKTIPVTAIVENAATADAVVLDAEGNPLSGEQNLADAISSANASAGAATIRLRRDVTITSALPAITRSLTFDLRGRTITNTAASRTPALIVGDGSNAPTVTLTDSRVDGEIKHEASVAGELVTLDVVKGKLIAAAGKITATNTSSDVSASAIAVNIQTGAQGELRDNGIVQATATANNATGIKAAGTLVTNGGEITATAASKAIAVDVTGTCTVNGGTFSATATGSEATGMKAGASAALTVKGGTISANAASNAYAIYSSGATTVEKGELAAVASSSTAYAFCQNGAGKTSTISGGKFKATVGSNAVANVYQQAGTLRISGGVYAGNTNLTTLATAPVRNLNPESADYQSGYRYTVGDNPNAVVARIGDMYFPSLVSALSYVNNNPNLVSTIILLEDEILPEGKYKIPANASLLIPYKDNQYAIDAHPTSVYSYQSPDCYRTLTLESGARLDIYGKVQVGAKQAGRGNLEGKNGSPTEAYGKIAMEEGSTITVEGDGHLYAWGYVVGQGTIDVKRNGTVHEMMQITDWRGGQTTFSFNDNLQKVFPLNQYHIQNIEVPTTFRPGAKELIDGVVNALNRTFPFTDVLLIGGNGQKCMFSMDLADISEDTWVRKWYDAANDKQVYDINNSAQVSSLVLTLNIMDLMTVSFNSAMYVLPLTNNMKIHLLTGELAITQDVLLTPGAEIEVDKEATAYIVAGKNLYVMDADDWMTFPDGANVYPVPYSPSWAGGVCPRTTATLSDAKINVHGTFRVDGAMYTTENGANIFSSNDDAGTLLIRNAAPAEDAEGLYLANRTKPKNGNQESTSPDYQKVVANPARLRNGDATFAETRGAEAGRTYAYYNDHWRNWETVGCLAKETKNDGTEVYYAKPADYVPLASNEPNPADHLYHLAATDPDNGQPLTPRLFILMDDCQWWEVTKVPNQDELYYCAKNNVYYFYDDAADIPQWKEKLLTVRWLDSDGTTLLHEYTNVHYGDKAQYFHDDPVKAPDGYKTYDFIGWLPEPAEHLTSDASYVAQYQENIKECTITFRDANGDLIEQNQVQIGQVPVCTGAPAGIGELYDWYPPIHAVTADEEYMLVAREIKQYYELTFLDWDNTMLLNVSDVPAGKTISVAADAGGDYYLTIEDETTPIQFDANPNKPGNNGRQYTLTGWSPNLAAVDGDAIYTAVYQESLQKFAITLNAIGGGSLTANISGTGAGGNEYEYGTQLTLTATPSTGYYLQKWQDNLVAPSRTITVTGAATYEATFSNEYDVVLRTNGGSILANGRSTYTYDAVNDTPLPGASDLRHDTDETLTALGWYAKADFSGQETWAIPAGTAKNLVYYLKWSDPQQQEPEGETFEDQVGRADPSGSGYYATFYSSTSNYIVPDGYTAYKAVIVGERIHLEAIGGIIPAGEGVLLHSETANLFDLLPTAEDAWEIGQNDFTGTDETLPYADITGGTPYVFSAVNGVIGFYKLSSTASIPAHRAYVLWTSGQSAPPRMLRIDRPNVTTDITIIETAEPVKQLGIFSILGHELAEPIHGTINIIDGELKYIP